VSGKRVERRELWRQRIAQQTKSGQSIRAFCRERGLSEPGFYAWRQRLRTGSQVRFALVETKAAAEVAVPIELILASGDRLRIPTDAATLRLVLAVLRDQV
jgi:transposase-like protein